MPAMQRSLGGIALRRQASVLELQREYEKFVGYGTLSAGCAMCTGLHEGEQKRPQLSALSILNDPSR